jgi:hypothetical protein
MTTKPSKTKRVKKNFFFAKTKQVARLIVAIDRRVIGVYHRVSLRRKYASGDALDAIT